MNETLQTQIRSLVELSGLPAPFGEDLITRNVATIEAARTAVFAEAARRTPTIQHQAPAVVTREAAPEEIVRAMSDGLYARVNPMEKLSEQARPVRIPLSQWADQHARLSSEASARAGAGIRSRTNRNRSTRSLRTPRLNPWF